MARSHARMQFGMWRKPGHEKVGKDARLMYHTILLDETLNQAGVVRLSLDVWADDAAMTSDEAQSALNELREQRFVIVDGWELLVRTFIRNDHVADQPNVLRNALDVALHVRSPVLRSALAEELRKLPPAPAPKEMPPRRKGEPSRMFRYPDPHAVADELDPGERPPPMDRESSVDAVPNPSESLPVNPSPEPFSERDTGTPRGRGRGGGSGSCTENSTNKTFSSTIADATDDPPRLEHPPVSEPRPDVEALCERLRDRIVANDLKAPTITETWRKEARLMLDRDGRDHAQAMRLIDWCQADPFWHANILSIPKFRKQYDQLLAKAREQHRRAGPAARSSPTASAAEATREAFRARREAPSNVHALPYANGI